MVRPRKVSRLVAAAWVVLALGAARAAAGPATAGPVAPAGFRAETFARGLSHPTAMAYGPDGRIYATESDGILVSITRGTKKPRVLLRGLRIPLGLAWHGRTLFISEEGRLEQALLSRGHFVRR
jgi:glucose/arabinose dehydrogenase